MEYQLAVAAFLAAVLTSAGELVGAGVVTTIVEATKKFLPRAVVRRERWFAAGITALLVLVAYVAGLQAVPPTQQLSLVALLALLIPWYKITRLAMAAHDDVTRRTGSLTERPLASAEREFEKAVKETTAAQPPVDPVGPEEIVGPDRQDAAGE